MLFLTVSSLVTQMHTLMIPKYNNTEHFKSSDQYLKRVYCPLSPPPFFFSDAGNEKLGLFREELSVFIKICILPH